MMIYAIRIMFMISFMLGVLKTTADKMVGETLGSIAIMGISCAALLASFGIA